MIQGRDIQYELGIIFNLENKTNTWQEVLISMKPPNCTPRKFFVIKESLPVQDVTKRNKLILDVEHNKINLIMSLNHLKIKLKISLLELLQKYENNFMVP